ncbi:MAG: hypothetical protein R2762_18650 [Bryobacteraceae bacterium]
MRNYIMVTGAVFGLITVAHLVRIVYEPHLAKEPWYALLTAAAASLAVWAARLLRGRA